MPDICRIGDESEGHGGYGPAVAIEGDAYMVVNGQPVHCVGHAWQTHSDGSSSHQGRLAAGSSYYFVNGRAVGRVGDPIDCGDTVASGDPYFVIHD